MSPGSETETIVPHLPFGLIRTMWKDPADSAMKIRQ